MKSLTSKSFKSIKNIIKEVTEDMNEEQTELAKKIIYNMFFKLKILFG